MNTNCYISPNDYLAHYGVLGMKWGHRKQKPYNSMSVGQKQRYLEKQYYEKASKIGLRYRDQKKAIKSGSGSKEQKRAQIKKAKSNMDRAVQRNSNSYYKKMGAVQSNKQAAGRIAAKAALAMAGSVAITAVSYKAFGPGITTGLISRYGAYTIGSIAGYSAGRDLAGIIGNKMNKKKK